MTILLSLSRSCVFFAGSSRVGDGLTRGLHPGTRLDGSGSQAHVPGDALLVFQLAQVSNRHPTGTNARIIELYPHLVLTSHVPPIFLISGEVRDGSDAILVVGIFYPLASLEAVKCIHICSPFHSLSFGETCRTNSA